MITRRQFLQSASLLSLCSPSWSSNQNLYNTDVAIIGSGPAGLAVADRLSKSGIKVLVIESGPLDGFDEHAQKRNDVLDAGYGLPYPLGFATKRMAGGTSNAWGGHCPRLKQDDLMCRSKFGYAADWPLSYQELNHYYCEAESFLKVFNPAEQCNQFILSDDSKNLANILNEHGFRDAVAASVTVNNKGEYQPLRLRQAYLPTLLENKSFSLITDTTARNFEIDKSGTVKSVLCKNNYGLDVKVNCQAAIICGGAIQSARLLMLANNHRSGPAMGNTGGHLGANFMDHTAVKLIALENRKPSQKTTLAAKFGQAHIWQWYGRYRTQGIGAYLPLVVQTDTAPGDEKTLQFNFLCEQEPRYDNRFELSKKDYDEFGDPLPMLWYKLSDFDKKTMQHTVENMTHFFEKNNSLKLSNEKEFHLGRHHLMGTTRMAKKDKDGVVDENLKVFGSNNLYILSGGVFPSGGAANPTLTIVALAMRLANHLVKK